MLTVAMPAAEEEQGWQSPETKHLEVVSAWEEFANEAFLFF
jgi:hypothetical protein